MWLRPYIFKVQAPPAWLWLPGLRCYSVVNTVVCCFTLADCSGINYTVSSHFFFGGGGGYQFNVDDNGGLIFTKLSPWHNSCPVYVPKLYLFAWWLCSSIFIRYLLYLSLTDYPTFKIIFVNFPLLSSSLTFKVLHFLCVFWLWSYVRYLLSRFRKLFKIKANLFISFVCSWNFGSTHMWSFMALFYIIFQTFVGMENGIW